LFIRKPPPPSHSQSQHTCFHRGEGTRHDVCLRFLYYPSFLCSDVYRNTDRYRYTPPQSSLQLTKKQQRIGTRTNPTRIYRHEKAAGKANGCLFLRLPRLPCAPPSVGTQQPNTRRVAFVETHFFFFFFCAAWFSALWPRHVHVRMYVYATHRVRRPLVELEGRRKARQFSPATPTSYRMCVQCNYRLPSTHSGREGRESCQKSEKNYQETKTEKKCCSCSFS
jgi:hypothetical protein